MSSFFDNQHNAAIAMIILGAVMAVIAVINAAVAIFNEDGVKIGVIVEAVGLLVGGLLFAGFGMRVNGKSSSNVLSDKLGLSGGAISDKFAIIAEYVHVYAISEIIIGIFALVGGIIDASSAIGTGIIAIIIGLVSFWAYGEITNKKTNLADNIIWIILLVLFVLEIIGGIIICIGIITIPLGLCYIIIGVFMTAALLDPEIKKKFGM